MLATLTTESRNGTNYGDTKELISALSVVALDNRKKPYNVMSVRWYMGRSSNASIVYCTVWVHTHQFHTSGSGKAGGGGYHKKSAAFANALENAGIELSESIHGVGDGAIDRACAAIVTCLSLGTQTEPLIIRH